jgi:hypothetical protein
VQAAAALAILAALFSSLIVYLFARLVRQWILKLVGSILVSFKLSANFEIKLYEY